MYKRQNYGFAKDVMNGGYVPPFAFILFRVVGASLLFWLTSLFFYEKISIKDIPRFILCGIFGVTANQLMFFSGLELTSTIHASIIMVTSPIIVSILSALILYEKVQTQKVMGIIIGLIGATLIIMENTSNSGTSGIKPNYNTGNSEEHETDDLQQEKIEVPAFLRRQAN